MASAREADENIEQSLEIHHQHAIFPPSRRDQYCRQSTRSTWQVAFVQSLPDFFFFTPLEIFFRCHCPHRKHLRKATYSS